MRRISWWTGAVFAAGACFGGSSGGSGSPNAAAAGALTSGVMFDGGTVKPGELPDTTKLGVALRASPEPLPLVPGAASILPLGVDNPEEASDPLTAVLLQFDGAEDHVEVMVSAIGGEVMIPFTIDADVCAELCNETYTLTLTEAPLLDSGGVGEHGTVTVMLDCTESGDPAKCAPTPSGGGGSLPTGDLAQSYYEATVSLTEAFCVCQGLSADLCQSSLGATTAAAECFAATVDANEDAVRGIVECALEEIESLASCVRSADCTDPTVLPCDYEARTAAIDTTCGVVPADVQAEFDACYEPPSIDIPCPDGTMSIPSTAFCDGTADCSDGSDEAGCSSGMDFMCGDGTTYPASFQCDCYYDCVDMSDEVGCVCFTCDDGQIIQPSWECDGVPDCGDGSDEASCP